MPKRKAGYEEMFDDVVEALKHSPDEVKHVFETSEKVVEAANDLTKDELALVSAYVKSDLKEFADSYEESKSGPFYLMVADSIWQGLLEITDRTKVEWVELFADLEHQGLYQAGEVIGLGVLVCDDCGHKTQYNHPTVIIPCTKCGSKAFSRQALKP
ncbi:zinc ribbon-containing protein [Vibrio sp. Isolate25]|uniref:zinc ribbon-containing protein n=1 Tax=Vibrio TaxID=662 RepID=UPI001EFD2E60|nr:MULTISPECIES: zinc ribbon-containing protein [Vibrio]MCG9596686.1 zinc ribbon-containing protein [Vibrio sp. Isolate25]MCG9684339.1 zinc ribbon-containing protein [Vibrio sp. Isolate23]USD31855.1 zinc ribbon-containing protein [Vibrio sp. SCSIO 43186]USD44900.1 zinc ribbon-containing protein [Vibrio sp. SCSIO 43145]USD68978.1 zinc ribbon-containing protein [Vibrio sp. SCSIO 43139]